MAQVFLGLFLFYYFPMNYLQITEKNISEVLEKFDLVILDFYTDWCGPCKSFAPIFHKVSTLYPQVCFGTVNSEKELLLSEDFSIRSIPTIVVLKEQTIIFERSGAMFEHSLVALVEEALKVDVSKLPQEEDQEL
jgi:thioredoxin